MHTAYKVDFERGSVSAPPVLNQYRGRAIAIGGVGVILTIIGFVLDPAQAFHSYLIGFLWCLGLTLGPLGMLFVWHMTGGRWGFSMRRIWEAATRNIYYCAFLFLPILLWGYRYIYPWTKPETIPANLQFLLHDYLNYKFFFVRAVIYFIIWFVIIHLANKWSAELDRPLTRPVTWRFAALGAAGVLLYFWSMSFAAIDWIMSITPGWPSTIYAMIVIVGQGISGLAIGIILGSVLVKYEPMNGVMDDVVFHDNGKLLFAFTMLWAYTSFSQWLIIWSGNLPDEISWYLNRLRGGWGWVSLFVVLFHFCIPFCILLSSALKKDPARLVWVAAWMILMRPVDLWWNIEPTIHREHFHLSWMDFVIPLGLAGIWTALFLRNLMSRPLLALYDPKLRALVGAEEHE